MPSTSAAIAAIAGAAVVEDVPLSRLTTWRAGGPVSLLVTLDTTEALREALAVLTSTGIAWLPLGNGSNVLFADHGFKGAVLRLGGELAFVCRDGDTIRAGGGAPMSAAVRESERAGLTGLEWACGIPGTAGGAVMTNAGTFAGSAASGLVCVSAVRSDGSSVAIEEFGEQHRRPLVPRGLVLAEVVWRLMAGARGEIRGLMDQVRERRRTQPSEAGTAGSVFKNPAGDHAGRLIEACGLKGACHGEAYVSEKHANFIINRGGASASDIKALIERVENTVMEMTGVALEREVELIGFEQER